jgi:hypothetical protein
MEKTMGSDRNVKIKALNELMEHLRQTLVHSIEVGADRSADGSHEIPLFEMLKSGAEMMELSYKVKIGLLTEDEAREALIGKTVEKYGEEYEDSIRKAFGNGEEDSATNRFEDLPEDKKKLVN